MGSVVERSLMVIPRAAEHSCMLPLPFQSSWRAPALREMGTEKTEAALAKAMQQPCPVAAAAALYASPTRPSGPEARPTDLEERRRITQASGAGHAQVDGQVTNVVIKRGGINLPCVRGDVRKAAGDRPDEVREVSRRPRTASLPKA